MIGSNGHILNGLYRGRKNELVKQLKLTDHPYTENMVEDINLKIPTLAVRYIPNMKPNRMFRGSNIGMSDYGGIEGLMDALDETYTSWMRDIRLGKAKAMVPETWLKTDESGEIIFDEDEEIYTMLQMDPMSAAKSNVGITQVQFNIRTEEHEKTAMGLLERIVTSAGYSPQSFGLNIEGRAESGTALNIRERKTFNTASKKQNYWKGAMEEILEIMLMIDNKMLGNKAVVHRPTISFSDSVQPDTLTLATTVELITRAQAATARTKVAMLHPDWSKEQIEEEAAQIEKEMGLGVPDPMQAGIS